MYTITPPISPTRTSAIATPAPPPPPPPPFMPPPSLPPPSLPSAVSWGLPLPSFLSARACLTMRGASECVGNRVMTSSMSAIAWSRSSDHSSSSPLCQSWIVCDGAVLTFASSRNFRTVAEATMKLKPWTSPRLPNVDRPITSPLSLIVGPPELPCVIDALIWMIGSPELVRLIADTAPSLIVASSWDLSSSRPCMSAAPG